MYSKLNESHQSPDLSHRIDFLYQGEIRFGPACYRVKLDGRSLKKRNFGLEFLWDEKSEFLALQEWQTTEFGKGPVTILLLIDLKNNRMARLSVADQGFIKPLRFENENIIYKKEMTTGQIIEYEIEIDTIENWEKMK